jgi:hypothetical protein
LGQPITIVAAATLMSQLFIDNSKKHADAASEEIKAAGPSLETANA